MENKIVKAKSVSTEITKTDQIVLEEDEYTKGLETIIERDFFPDIKKARALSRNPNSLSTPNCDSPKTFETPVNINPDTLIEEDHVAKRRKIIEKDSNTMSLNGYLAKYTSEDNASFDIIKKEDLEKHKHKYPWLYKDEAAEKQKIQNMLEYKDDPKDPTLMWSYKNNNALMYVPEGVELTLEEKIKNASKKQATVFSNTRFETNPFNEKNSKEVIAELASTQAKLKEGKVGIDGKELLPSDSPCINNYGFVPSTPTPIPGVAESPLMTWGEIDSTPARLDGDATPHLPGTPQFRIPDIPTREKIAMSLSNKIKKDKKNTKALNDMKSKLLSPLARLGSPSLGNLSPAAQRLACNKLGINRGSDSSLRASYSPVSRVSPSPIRIPQAKTTPINLTDDLLQIPPRSRARAADYF